MGVGVGRGGGGEVEGAFEGLGGGEEGGWLMGAGGGGSETEGLIVERERRSAVGRGVGCFRWILREGGFVP